VVVGVVVGWGLRTWWAPKTVRVAALDSVLAAAPIGYLEVDEDNRLVRCNAQGRLLLGVAPEEEGRLLLQSIRSYELDRLIEGTRQLGRSLQRQWTFRRVAPDPLHPVTPKDIPLRGTSLVLTAGRIGIFLEDRAAEVTFLAQRDRWTSDIAHELKTPLTSIRLVAEMLQGKSSEELRPWFERLLAEVNRLTDLVQDLLELSKLDTQTPLLLRQSILDLVATVQEAWQSLEPLARAKNVRLLCEGPEELWVRGDASRLHRLFLNLLDNALEYSPASQVIWVQVEPVDALTVQVEVVDAGPGFPPEALPRVFERFFRADPSRARGGRPGGSGLGLAIARQIVQAHQGEIVARNHPDTGGAWLQMQLPIRCAEPAP
ncbi:MAG TPA: PAS domain-containing sensor histidine kinase, partial [Cyanobacteria bacterium UBA8156]|nr:PAS domain-containing sensor histidine kinase [Cyanobacteria bacterium UBA8156]